MIRLCFENETVNRLKMEIEKTMRVNQNFKGEELCNDVIHEFVDREREREKELTVLRNRLFSFEYFIL